MKKKTYLLLVEIVANVLHMYIVSSLTQHLNITEKILLLLLKFLLINNSRAFKQM